MPSEIKMRLSDGISQGKYMKRLLGFLFALTFSCSTIVSAETLQTISGNQLSLQLAPIVWEQNNLSASQMGELTKIEIAQSQAESAIEQTLKLSKQIYLNQEDILEIQIVPDDLIGFSLLIKLKENAQDKMKKLVKEHTGQQFALLDSKKQLLFATSYFLNESDGMMVVRSGMNLAQVQKMIVLMRQRVELRLINHEDSEILSLKTVSNDDFSAFGWLRKSALINQEAIDFIEIKRKEIKDNQGFIRIYQSIGKKPPYYSYHVWLHFKKDIFKPLKEESVTLLGCANRVVLGRVLIDENPVQLGSFSEWEQTQELIQQLRCHHSF